MKTETTDKMKKMYIHDKPWEKVEEGEDGIIEVKISEVIPFARYTGCVTLDDNDKVTQTKEEKLWSKKRMKGLRLILKRFFKAPESSLYPWEALKNSIQKEGYDPEKYGYIAVRTRKEKDGKRQFQVINGNHRIEVLSVLYGPDYTLKVKKTNTATLKGIFKILPQGLMNVPVMHYPSFIFFCWYLFLPILITAAVVYTILCFVKDIRHLAKTDTHPHKNLTLLYNRTPKLYQFIMNIYYNLTYVISSIVILIFTIYLFSTYWLEFFIMLGITFMLLVGLNYLIYKLNIEKTAGSLTMTDIIEHNNRK
jgi:hypothetical protein